MAYFLYHFSKKQTLGGNGYKQEYTNYPTTIWEFEVRVKLSIQLKNLLLC